MSRPVPIAMRTLGAVGVVGALVGVAAAIVSLQFFWSAEWDATLRRETCAAVVGAGSAFVIVSGAGALFQHRALLVVSLVGGCALALSVGGHALLERWWFAERCVEEVVVNEGQEERYMLCTEYDQWPRVEAMWFTEARKSARLGLFAVAPGLALALAGLRLRLRRPSRSNDKPDLEGGQLPMPRSKLVEIVRAFSVVACISPVVLAATLPIAEADSPPVAAARRAQEMLRAGVSDEACDALELALEWGNDSGDLSVHLPSYREDATRCARSYLERASQIDHESASSGERNWCWQVARGLVTRIGGLETALRDACPPPPGDACGGG
jgi:hypothetical protein